jgi:hypothetical protein
MAKAKKRAGGAGRTNGRTGRARAKTSRRSAASQDAIALLKSDIHHEAEVEHDGAKKLIAEIQSKGPDDDYFDARVSVLSEMIKHHVKEEEARDGMFERRANPTWTSMRSASGSRPARPS